MKYLVVSYKASSDDYCRGCHMASYSSDHHIEILTKDEAIDHVSTLEATQLSVNECGYDHWIYEMGNDELYYGLDDDITLETERKIKDMMEAEQLKKKIQNDRIREENVVNDKKNLQKLIDMYGVPVSVNNEK